jgi:multidrug efflux pump subunit AcrA (membrane-fusion protein)
VAREGETVKAGEPLVLLEPHDLDASLAEAQATLHQAEARLALLSAGYRKEEIEQAKRRLSRLKPSWINSSPARGDTNSIR